MNLSHDALRDLTALAELKSEGAVLKRQSSLLKAHAIKGRLVGAASLEGFRMPLQLKRIGEMSEEKHATNVDGKVAPRYSRTVWRLGGLCNAFWTNRKDLLTLLDDEDDMSPEDEAIGMVVQDGFTPSAGDQLLWTFL